MFPRLAPLYKASRCKSIYFIVFFPWEGHYHRQYKYCHELRHIKTCINTFAVVILKDGLSGNGLDIYY